ncbi:hypothetical protein [Streptomyces sp. NPDC003863]
MRERVREVVAVAGEARVDDVPDAGGLGGGDRGLVPGDDDVVLPVPGGYQEQGVHAGEGLRQGLRRVEVEAAGAGKPGAGAEDDAVAAGEPFGDERAEGAGDAGDEQHGIPPGSVTAETIVSGRGRSRKEAHSCRKGTRR